MNEQDKRRLLLDWGRDIFQTEGLDLIWRPKTSHLVLHDEQGLALSGCGLLQQEVAIGSERRQVGGIGSVVTPPDVQGRGHARRVLQEALRIFADEWSLDAGMLFCREALIPFYRNAGWKTLEDQVQVLQAAGPRICPVAVMVYPLHQPWPPGEVTIDSLPW